MLKSVLLGALALLIGATLASPAEAFGDGCGAHAIGCYDKVRLPDVYATRTRSVLVSPGWRDYVATPPIIRNYAVPVLVRPGRWRTVLRPPVYATRFERVMVAPPSRVYEDVAGRRIVHTTPAVYAKVAVPVVVRPPSAAQIYQPPIRALFSRPIVVAPSYLVTFDHPAIVGVVREKVFVRHGGYAWTRSRPSLFVHW